LHGQGGAWVGLTVDPVDLAITGLLFIAVGLLGIVLAVG
jgi:hypothetical protein